MGGFGTRAVEIFACGQTHQGHVRARNEDAVYVGERVFVVADGMGGHRKGDVASAAVAEVFERLDAARCAGADEVEDAVAESHRVVRGIGSEFPEPDSVGTTLVALVLVEHQGESMWLVVNIGDSRLYRVRRGVADQVTQDHSYVQELVAAGTIPASAAKIHPHRNVVTRAVGVSETAVADYTLLPTTGIDRFVLCSDGVHGEVDDDRLLELMVAEGRADSVSAAIIDEVLVGQARDNATVIVVDTESVVSAEVSLADAITGRRFEVPLALADPADAAADETSDDHVIQEVPKWLGE